MEEHMICRNGQNPEPNSAVHAGKALRLMLLALFGFFAYLQGTAQESPLARTTFTPARMARSIGTTARVATVFEQRQRMAVRQQA